MLQLIPQPPDMFGPFLLLAVKRFQGRCHTGDQRHRLSTGTTSGFLMPAFQKRRQLHTPTQQQPPDSSWTVKFVCAKRQRCGFQLPKTHRNLADSLHCVNQQRHPMGLTQLRQF